MIARIWHGKTPKSKYETYNHFLLAIAIPDHKSTPGLEQLRFLRRIEGDEAHFLLITYRNDMEAIREFA